MLKWFNWIKLENKISFWMLLVTILLWIIPLLSYLQTITSWNNEIINQEYDYKVKMYWDLIKKYDGLFDDKAIMEDYEILFQNEYSSAFNQQELNCLKYWNPLKCNIKFTEWFPNIITEKQYNFLNQVLSKRYIELDDYIKRNYPLNYYNDILQLFRRFIIESIYLDKSFYNECEDKNFLFWFSACWYKLDNFIIDGKFIMKKDSEIRDLFNTDLNSYK